MSYLGVLGYVTYTDLQADLQKCRKKASELQQKVKGREKENTPPNQTSPYFRPESYWYCRERDVLHPK